MVTSFACWQEALGPDDDTRLVHGRIEVQAAEDGAIAIGPVDLIEVDDVGLQAVRAVAADLHDLRGPQVPGAARTYDILPEGPTNLVASRTRRTMPSLAANQRPKMVSVAPQVLRHWAPRTSRRHR
ncbi:MAG TPA: hypothetical protein PK306_10845 [Aquabacterium sp.]|nr:hypothetical protein [Aquabacterium sp.]